MGDRERNSTAASNKHNRMRSKKGFRAIRPRMTNDIFIKVSNNNNNKVQCKSMKNNLNEQFGATK